MLGVGLSYDAGENLEVYSNLSQNYRSVTFSNIQITNPAFKVDPNITDEEGYTFDLGMRGKWKDLISYDIGMYGILYKDRISEITNDRAQRERKNVGDALILGLEFFADWNVAKSLTLSKDAKLNWFINSAFTQSEYLATEVNNVEGNEVEAVPNVNVKTGVRFGYKNLLGSYQLTYISSQFTDVENTRIPDPKGVIGEIPAYSIMDFSLSYKLKSFKIETGVNNFLDSSYFTRRATGYPGPGIIPSEPRNYYLTLEIKI